MSEKSALDNCLRANGQLVGMAQPRAESGYEPDGPGCSPAAWRSFAYVPLLAAVFMATRPYHGIAHDARLYMMQTLARLHPDRLGDDRFFLFGSQDSFSLFGPLYAPLVAALGPAAAHDVSTALGLAGWFAALLWFAVSVFGRGPAAILAAAAVILLNPRYGSFNIFSYAEPFTTPRLLAEALVMAGLAMRQRLAWASACMLAAAALHPLMALPGIGVLGALAAWREPRLWLLAVAGVGLAAALAWTGVEPWGRAMLRFDDAWFRIVYERNPFAFLGQWDAFDLMQLVAPLVGVLLGFRVATRAERLVLSAVCLVAALGLLATWVGADLLRNVLATNLQPWRALWLFALLGNAFAAIAALRLPGGSGARSFLLLALAAGLAEQALRIPAVFSPALFGLALVAHLWEGWRQRPLPHLVWLSGMAVALLVMLGFGVFAAGFLLPGRVEAWGIKVLVVRIVVLLAGTVLLMLAVTRPARVSRGGVLAGGLALLLGASAIVDQRSGWVRFASSSEAREEIARFLGQDRQVYWEHGLDLLWFKQVMPSYYSCPQGSGVMFHASAAHEWHRRHRSLSALKTVDIETGPRTLCPAPRQLGENTPNEAAAMVQLCQELSDLDAVILLVPVPGLPTDEWRAPSHAEVTRVAGQRQPSASQRLSGVPVFHRYRCADLRPAPAP